MRVSDERWSPLLYTIKQKPGGIIYVIGSNDSGKSTLCNWLAENLSKECRTAYIDCDPGQSLIGPPTTVGLQLLFVSEGMKHEPYYYFVGSTTPRGYLLQTLVGIKKLAEKAVSLGAQWIILDSSGFVLDPVAREFQFRVIDLLQPNYLITLFRPEEDFRWVNNFVRHPKISLCPLPISSSVVPRTPADRRAYREEKFKKYFEAAESQELILKGIGFHGRIPNLRNPARYRQLLVALCDADDLLITLGIIEQVDLANNKIQLYAPKFDATKIVFVQFGSLYLNSEGQQLNCQPYYE